jgi:DNA-binding MurR/RpiR family transcriptional regulator
VAKAKRDGGGTAGEWGATEVAFARTELGQRLLDALNDEALAGGSTRTVAEYLLRNPFRVAAVGIEELAEQAGVSTASVSRFARHIGFAGYPALRAALADALQTVLQPVEKLRASIERSADGPAPLYASLESSVNNLQASASGIEPKLVERLIDRLTRAHAVYVMGFGLSSHIAGSLALGLQPFCSQVISVVEYGGTEVAAGRLMNIGPDDVLIVISFPRYALDVLRLTQYARARKAFVVAMTDSPASPLASLGDALLVARSDHPVLPSSFVAPLAVAEALIAALMVSNKRNVNKAARLTEAISSYLYSTASPTAARERGGSTPK